MENTVKNIHLLNLTPDQKERLEVGAKLYKRNANIVFKIIENNADELIIKVTQGKNAMEKYLSKNELIQRANSLMNSFSDAVNFNKIIVHPTPFQPHPASAITPEYLKIEFQKRNLRIKDVQLATGLETSNISAWLNHKREMSNITKAMFHFYLASI